MVVVEVGITLSLVALAGYAWWAIRPVRTRPDDRSRDDGGDTFGTGENAADGGSDGGAAD